MPPTQDEVTTSGPLIDVTKAGGERWSAEEMVSCNVHCFIVNGRPRSRRYCKKALPVL